MSKFKSSLHRFCSAIEKTSLEDLKDIKKSDITNFSQKKKTYEVNLLNSSFKSLISSASELDSINNPDIKEIKSLISILEDSFEKKDFETTREITANLMILESKISPKKKTESLSFRIQNIPHEISTEMEADLRELDRCFHSDCYRASVILCGRLLEIALHRVYYQATNNDLLEKSPGIGLGNLIAKLKQNNVQLDPAVSQQIHLINQVRIYSVHKKQQAFCPTKEQTHAIILYTIDIIRKLFSTSS